jgi:hypothetical protein
MKRSTRLALSGLVLLVSALLGIVAAFLAGYMINHARFDLVAPVTLVGILAAFVGVTGLGTLLGLRYVWDRLFDVETHTGQRFTLK